MHNLYSGRFVEESFISWLLGFNFVLFIMVFVIFPARCQVVAFSLEHKLLPDTIYALFSFSSFGNFSSSFRVKMVHACGRQCALNGKNVGVFGLWVFSFQM